MGALWQRAVHELLTRQHRRARGQQHRLRLVVDQLTNLDEQAPSFTGDARLRGRAIDERCGTLSSTSRSPSRLAQQARACYRAMRMSSRVSAPDAGVQLGGDGPRAAQRGLAGGMGSMGSEG